MSTTRSARPGLNPRPHSLAASLALALTAIVGSTVLPPSKDLPEDPRQAGNILAEALRSQKPPEAIQTTGVLRLRNAQGKRSSIPVKFELQLQQDAWISIYESIPTNQSLPQRLEVVHTPGQPNHYAYATAPGQTNRPFQTEVLGADRLYRSFAGSDFYIADLGLDFLHWPDQRLVRTEMRKGRSCRVLESQMPSPPAGAYYKVLSWIDLETGGLLRAEAFDSNNQVLKEFTVRSVKKGQLKEVQLRNLKSDSVTRLEFDLDLQGYPDTEE
jgi:hypothetical protein